MVTEETREIRTETVRVAAAKGSRSKFSLRIGALLLPLTAVTFGTYYPALRAQLVADDFSLVGQISFRDAMGYFHSSSGFGRNEYRPLTVMSYAIDGWFWGANPAGFHLTNILLHAITADLLYLTVYALSADIALGWLAGLIFAIHPVNHSRVVWIAARDGSICAMFLMASLLLYILGRRRKRRIYRLASATLCGCALLAYEGAIILPALLFAIEFLCFSRSGPLRRRAGESLRKTGAFWGLTVVYLLVWQMLFAGNVRGYSLSFRLSDIATNYARLLSNLFYASKQWVFAVLYAALLVLSYRALIARWKLTAFGTLLALLAFLPYCFTNGFAYRFGYISALGMALLLALCILGTLRSARPVYRLAGAGIAIVLCAWYLAEDQRLVGDWIAAGEIANQIPKAIVKLHPRLPAGALLVLKGVPVAHGKAYVFPVGLQAAIQHEYPVPILVEQHDASSPDLNREKRASMFVFEYKEGKEPVREVAQH